MPEQEDVRQRLTTGLKASGTTFCVLSTRLREPLCIDIIDNDAENPSSSPYTTSLDDIPPIRIYSGYQDWACVLSNVGLGGQRIEDR